MRPDTLAQGANIPIIRAQLWAGPLSEAMDRYGVAPDPKVMAMFLANVTHECGQFRMLTELWGPTHDQARYDLRADLGNTHPEAIRLAKLADDGAGHYFRGRGCIQLTGYFNMLRFSEDFYGDDRVVHEPRQLEVPTTGAAAAGWFWKSRKLNSTAQSGTPEAFKAVVRTINGGYNGLNERLGYWGSFTRALAAA